MDHGFPANDHVSHSVVVELAQLLGHPSSFIRGHLAVLLEFPLMGFVEPWCLGPDTLHGGIRDLARVYPSWARSGHPIA